MIVLLSGLSGAGKTTLAKNVKTKLTKKGISTEIIDGDVYRKTLCKDLGFSKADRMENIRRLGNYASTLSKKGIVCIVSAINPYQQVRKELKTKYTDVKIIFLDCSLNTLITRDTKGLYKRAFLPAGHPDKVNNLTGVNDDFDIPQSPDLYINTDIDSVEESALNLFSFIKAQLSNTVKNKVLA